MEHNFSAGTALELTPQIPMPPDWKKYILVFFITTFLFGTGFWTSSFLGDRKLSELKALQDDLAVNILSSETRFAILGELACEDADKSFLSTELNELARKMEYSERNLSGENLANLRKQYFLLEIKDYLLLKKIRQRCNLDIDSILYFYSNGDDCPDCEKQGYVLTALRGKYDSLRVYSFDAHADLSAVQALLDVYGRNELPLLAVNGKAYRGFRDAEFIETLMSAKALSADKK